MAWKEANILKSKSAYYISTFVEIESLSFTVPHSAHLPPFTVFCLPFYTNILLSQTATQSKLNIYNLPFWIHYLITLMQS